MSELGDHLDKANVLHFYREHGVISFNEAIRSLYILIRRAIRDGATHIKFDDKGISWGRSNIELGKQTFEMLPNGGQIHRDNMHVLLEKDPIVSKYIVTSWDDDTLVCQIVESD